MKSIVLFTTAILAWSFYNASASCTIGSHVFLPHQHHTLIGHSFLNQSGTVRIQCMKLCLMQSRCLSFNHNDISGICQLNDASKEDFPDSYKQDVGFSYFSGSSNKAKPLREEAMMTTETEQETSQTPKTTTKQVSTVPTDLSTETPETTSATSDISGDTEGPELTCPQGVFGLTNAGNPGQCTFLVTITVCNITPLGMESGTIADHQITAENVLYDDDANYGPAQARLNSNHSWCAKSYPPSWIQVDFGHTVDIYGLIFQPRYKSHEHAAGFYLTSSNDGNMTDPKLTDKYYFCKRRSDGHDVWVSVQTTSQKMIRSRFIRIHPKAPTHTLCMRFELIGCN